MKIIDTKTQLNSIGVKNTPQKATILKFISESSVPITVNDLHLMCIKELVMDIATVYRTLQQFKEKGIVHTLSGSEGVVHYEYTGQNFHSHPHFQCERCHEFICLEALGFEDAIYFSNMAKNHKVNSINITLSGVCERCQ